MSPAEWTIYFALNLQVTLHRQPRTQLLASKLGEWLRRPLAEKWRSLGVRAARLMHRVEDALFELWHGLDCTGVIATDSLDTEHTAALAHANAYEAVRCAHVRELLAEARKTGIAFDNFIDLGSGKGKACFYAAARARFRKIIGVEFSGPLVGAANENKQRFGAPNISFVNGDAAHFVLPAGNNLVFMFNPFGEFILEQFLRNNLEHFRQGRSVIAYANDHQRLCIARLGFATVYRNQDSNGSLHRIL